MILGGTRLFVQDSTCYTFLSKPSYTSYQLATSLSATSLCLCSATLFCFSLSLSLSRLSQYSLDSALCLCLSVSLGQLSNSCPHLKTSVNYSFSSQKIAYHQLSSLLQYLLQLILHLNEDFSVPLISKYVTWREIIPPMHLTLRRDRISLLHLLLATTRLELPLRAYQSSTTCRNPTKTQCNAT